MNSGKAPDAFVLWEVYAICSAIPWWKSWSWPNGITRGQHSNLWRTYWSLPQIKCVFCHLMKQVLLVYMKSLLFVRLSNFCNLLHIPIFDVLPMLPSQLHALIFGLWGQDKVPTIHCLWLQKNMGVGAWTMNMHTLQMRSSPSLSLIFREHDQKS